MRVLGKNTPDSDTRRHMRHRAKDSASSFQPPSRHRVQTVAAYRPPSACAHTITTDSNSGASSHKLAFSPKAFSLATRHQRLLLYIFSNIDTLADLPRSKCSHRARQYRATWCARIQTMKCVDRLLPQHLLGAVSVEGFGPLRVAYASGCL